MPQTAGYRPTPTNPTTDTGHPAVATPSEADDWLEEIDSVLEDNALEVVRRYHQRSGE